MEVSDVTALAELWEQIVIRCELWQQIISRFPPDETPRHRRKHGRRGGSLGPVELAFEQGGEAVTRTGTLLNVSPEGVMIKQQDKIEPGTTVVMKAIPWEEMVVLKGRVIHCTETVGGFKVGIELRFADDEDD